MPDATTKIALYGAGKMGMAMVGGWLANGVLPTNISVIDPSPSDEAKKLGLAVNPNDVEATIAVLAVKPQIMSTLLNTIDLPDDALILSVAAGLPLAFFENQLGAARRIIRAMPNTPAAIGQGMTAIIGNSATTEADLAMAEDLLRSIGDVARLNVEGQMDVVTGLSGSGPAYVFHMIEAMRAAGEAEGLPRELAHQLALQTVAGAAAYAQQSGIDPAILRENVTSPGGTTAAGLAVLQSSLADLVGETVAAAAERSRALAKQ